jgi:hypothetical protein
MRSIQLFSNALAYPSGDEQKAYDGYRHKNLTGKMADADLALKPRRVHFLADEKCAQPSSEARRTESQWEKKCHRIARGSHRQKGIASPSIDPICPFGNDRAARTTGKRRQRCRTAKSVVQDEASLDKLNEPRRCTEG